MKNRDNWTEQRLEQLAQETGMSVAETRDVQLEENRTGKFRRYLRNIRDIALQLSPIALAAIIAGAGYMGNARVVELDRYDFNGDGVEDVLGIYSIKGTGKGLVGYIDGNKVEELNDISKARKLSIPMSASEYNVMIWDFKPLSGKMISDVYNHWQLADYLYVDDSGRETGEPIKLMEMNEFCPSEKLMDLVK